MAMGKKSAKQASDYSLRSTPPLVVVVGETASGKSALALELARRFNGEIIAADSWTVRQEVNIGTAKPSAQERAKAPHHLLDIVEPCADFSAAVFKKLADQTIEDIAGRGRIPIMVGGTGLYIDSVLFNFSFMRPGEPKQRQYLNSLSISQLLNIIYDRGFDLADIDIGNKRRLIRLIETAGGQPQHSDIRPYTLVIGLKISRAKLRANIERRTDQMFKKGLKHEVKQLVDRYGWDCEALKGIGYREWQAYFEGKHSLQQTKRRIVKSTLTLAKRQRTWFKRNRSIVWIGNSAESVAMVKDFLADHNT